MIQVLSRFLRNVESNSSFVHTQESFYRHEMQSMNKSRASPSISRVSLVPRFLGIAIERPELCSHLQVHELVDIIQAAPDPSYLGQVAEWSRVEKYSLER